MKKALIFGIALTLVCSAGFFSMSTAAEQDKGPEFIKITNGTDSSAMPAYFPHHDHQKRLDNNCGTCHHGKNEDGTQAKYEAGKTEHNKCFTCHNSDGITLEGKISGVPLPLTSPIQRAGHGRCAGCHKDQTSTATPLVNLMMCPTCHNKYKDKVK
jgi:hypothetical protein